MQKKEENMIKTLIRLLDKAESLQIKADLALQKVFAHIKFVGFKENDMPNISMCAGNEITLEWHGIELDQNEIIELMKTKSCIKPIDFDISYEEE